jgi:UDP-4-amino-4,6-dideoxy-N-acetyl-beta-L-altrosamine transaminase
VIPYGKQDINQADIDAVVDVLNSDFLTQGPQVPAFEAALSSYCGAEHALVTSSATAALHLACLALDVGEGDLVWTSAITFVATANCARYCGADVDFVDIDPQTFNMCPRQLESRLRETQSAGGLLPKVVIPVHMSGHSSDMLAISKLAEEFGFSIIEDAAHAIGGSHLDAKIGGCQFSDITVFSFHPVKIITTAEGGAALTNNATLAEKIALLRSHGNTRSPEQMTKAADGDWYYEQIELGFNYRMTDIQAALGCSQFTRLDDFVADRQRRAKRYEDLLKNLPLVLPCQAPYAESSWHLYVIRLQADKATVSHRELFSALRAAGIGVNLHYIPVPRQPYYARYLEQRGSNDREYPEADRYYAEAISIPLFHGMTDDQQDEVVTQLRKALQ